MRKRYVASKRHTIQVDFHPYMRLLRGRAASRPPNGAPAGRRLRGLGLPTPAR